MPSYPTIAALLHGYSWDAGADRVRLSSGVYLAPVSGSEVGALYKRLCTRKGIDEGDPLNYDVFLLFEPTPGRKYLLDHGDPYSWVDRACNIVVLFTRQPPNICRLIRTTNSFRSADETEVAFYAGGQGEFLTRNLPTIDHDLATRISTAWQRSIDLWNRDASGRIVNALTYFYYAWRSFYLDQTCIHLAILLEVLFAPHTQAETTHQIAFNVARFHGSTPAGREATFQLIKRFYNLRSTIVHGGNPSQDKLVDLVPVLFTFCADVLGTILGDADLTDVFANEHRRRLLLASYLFG